MRSGMLAGIKPESGSVAHWLTDSPPRRTYPTFCAATNDRLDELLHVSPFVSRRGSFDHGRYDRRLPVAGRR
jgi:hypothetical protein